MKALHLLPIAALLTGGTLMGNIGAIETPVRKGGPVPAISPASADLPLDKIKMPAGFSISVYAEVPGEVVQNRDAFSFFDAIVGGGDGILYETAGALGNGERVFITAKLPDYIRVGVKDWIEQYLFLTTSHDGLGSIKYFLIANNCYR